MPENETKIHTALTQRHDSLKPKSINWLTKLKQLITTRQVIIVDEIADEPDSNLEIEFVEPDAQADPLIHNIADLIEILQSTQEPSPEPITISLESLERLIVSAQLNQAAAQTFAKSLRAIAPEILKECSLMGRGFHDSYTEKQ